MLAIDMSVKRQIHPLSRLLENAIVFALPNTCVQRCTNFACIDPP
jgi:hypothetical protein